MEETAAMTTKKAFFVVGVVVFLIALSFVIPARFVGVSEQQQNPLILRSGDELNVLSEDRDSNNIPDWRDLALNAISTTTKEEIQKIPVDPVVKKRLDDPNNLTASFSKNLYIASAYVEKNGQTLTEEEQQNLVASVLQEEKKKIITKTYTLKDIRVTTEESTASKKAYGNALGVLLKKAESYNLARGDIALIESYLSSKNEDLLKAFVIKRNNIDSLISSLTSMSVPYSALPYHILVLNKLSAYRTTIDNFSQGASDPVRAAIVTEGYYDVAQSMLTSVQSMKEYFMLNAIVFSSSEPGYLLTSGYTK